MFHVNDDIRRYLALEAPPPLCPSLSPRRPLPLPQQDLQDLLANTLITMATVDRALIIHGAGLDEISPLGPSRIIEIRNTAAGTQGTYTTHFLFLHTCQVET